MASASMETYQKPGPVGWSISWHTLLIYVYLESRAFKTTYAWVLWSPCMMFTEFSMKTNTTTLLFLFLNSWNLDQNIFFSPL